ncbi:Rap1a/Tai family immunity protein [Polynucleobacter sp. IMCC 29146]|uniref:Rap1a/Tai family immunity protein n=1 Tax=Polynucleobacter sp. IMCC 29146 TaxID=2780953 RepID=UPI001F23B35F|nr:Rap1a/Tai family immunity protein [Polynucleobacter sp. IMCC 29146]MCE7529849.1 hypothetical protein [Polynucleobacter sp. IMCC 29146]
MKKQFLLSLIALGLASPFITVVYAQEKVAVLSTQEFITSCKSPASSESRSFCLGYATGLYDTYLVTRHPSIAKPFICVKQPGPTRDTVISDFVKWAEGKPALLNSPAADSALRYLAERFPCPA